MDVHDLLMRLPDAVDPAALEGMRVTVQYEIERPMYHQVADGRVTAIEGRAEHADVTIRASDALLLDLYEGRANPVMAFMTGKLRVEGDVTIARRMIAAVDRERLTESS